MSAANQITDQQRQRLLVGHHALPHREMVRHWLLSEQDMAHINERRRDQNRLGYAVQLCLLRYPGWPLRADEPAPSNLLDYIGQQLGAGTDEFAEYAKRDNTRQEHQLLIIKEYRFRQYGPACSPLLRAHLENQALSADSAFTLVESAMECSAQHFLYQHHLPTAIQGKQCCGVFGVQAQAQGVGKYSLCVRFLLSVA